MSVKAFDLVPAIEKVCWTDKVRTVIECLECSGKNIYVGTRESFIIHYILEEKVHPEGNILFTTRKKGQKYLEYRKPVVLLKAASVLNKIFLLCDGNLLVLSMFDLEILPGMSKLKGITYFCFNENPHDNNPFSLEMCIAKRKQLQLYRVTDDKVFHIRDINMPDSPLSMAMDGQYVCAAMTTKYVVVDTEGGHMQELFPYESESTAPLVKRITKEEFLLCGPSALGMFVTTAGISERPPLPWDNGIVSVAFSHPYIIVLSLQFLTVYSIIDQQPKQRIAFRGGCYMDNFEGRMYVASSDIICALIPVPWEKQVRALLADKKVAEALELARYSNKSGLSRDQSKKVFQRIQQQAGFIELSEFHFEEARELFKSGEVDVREIISLYPDLLPSTSCFTRIVPHLNDIANITQMCSSNPEMIRPCQEFLISYLEEIQDTPEAAGSKLEIDSALLKLYAETNSHLLISLVSAPDKGCDAKECSESLLKHGRYHALALFHATLGENEKALQVWASIITGEHSDTAFSGLPFMVEFLSKLSDHQLVWRYADFVLEKDEELGVQIFINRPEKEISSERMRPDLIADYLHRFPQALVCYLEYIVFDKKLEKEKFHTHLAVLYLDNVLHLMKQSNSNSEAVEAARQKFQNLLQFSSLYRVQLLLGKALEHQLHSECAVLYGKLEEHEKALRILVHQLHDYIAAENYCLHISAGRDRRFCLRLFHILLGVYLDPNLEEQKREELVAPAVHLLNSEVAEFDAAKVLQLIPPHWSVAIVDQFLNKALRNSLHRCRTGRVQSALARGENLQLRFSKLSLESTAIVMTEDRNCAVCKRPLLEPDFARYPNGAVTHLHCTKHYTSCPVAGRFLASTKTNAR